MCNPVSVWLLEYNESPQCCVSNAFYQADVPGVHGMWLKKMREGQAETEQRLLRTLRKTLIILTLHFFHPRSRLYLYSSLCFRNHFQLWVTVWQTRLQQGRWFRPRCRRQQANWIKSWPFSENNKVATQQPTNADDLIWTGQQTGPKCQET